MLESTIVQFGQKPLLLPCSRFVLRHSLRKYENKTALSHSFPLSHRFVRVWGHAIPLLPGSVVNRYRTPDLNWELTAQLKGAKVKQPALFIAGTGDMVMVK